MDKEEKTQEPTIGEILKTTREHLKISIEEVSKVLKIKPKDIEALEKNDIPSVASHLYISGFIKSYGKLLNINSKIIEKKIKELNIGSNVNNKKHRLFNIGMENIHTASKEMFFNAILVFTVLYLILLFTHLLEFNNSITTQTIINEFNQIN